MMTPGQRVRVKTWEELLATPGAAIDDDGDACIELSAVVFATDMKRWCGKEIDLAKPPEGWNFADWMLTPVEEAMEMKVTGVFSNKAQWRGSENG
jgi:hypothetical protein